VRARGPYPDQPLPAALTRWTGLAAYGIQRSWPTTPQVVVPSSRGPRGDARFQCIRSRSFPADALVRRGHLDLVPPDWLVRDLASVATTSVLTNVTIDLVQQRLLDLDRLTASVEGHLRFPGRGQLLEVLARLEAAGRTDSPLELTARDRLLAAGIPLDPGQVEVPCTDGRCLHLDLGIAAIRFGLDLESMLAHSGRAQLRTDIRRTNQLALVHDDWRVVRGTWEDLSAEGWPPFLELVTTVITQQSRRWLGRDWPA